MNSFKGKYKRFNSLARTGLITIEELQLCNSPISAQTSTEAMADIPSSPLATAKH
jgi:hypothetical protein